MNLEDIFTDYAYSPLIRTPGSSTVAIMPMR